MSASVAGKDSNAGPVVVCAVADLISGSGICALVHGVQVAVFYVPGANPEIYAIGNHDPIGNANVLSRGIVGDLKGRLVVASPLYKQHFDLLTGECMEDSKVSVPVFPVRLLDNRVVIG